MKLKYLIYGFFYLIVFLQSGEIKSQNYRTPKAYMNDFEKNESYVKESLIEYSTSVIYNYKDSRTNSTLERIYKKLEAINTNLIKNDFGYLGDTSLRDAFLKMNNSTIAQLKNKSLRLNDIENQKTLDFPEIMKCFALRQQEIINYYSLILDYSNCKRIFSKKNKIETDRYFNNKNLFEYDAHQSLIFFKLNVLDAKLCDLLLTTDAVNVSKCLFYINQVCDESKLQTEKYKKYFIDHSLNNANIEYIAFILDQNEKLIPLYQDYIQLSKKLNILKDNLNNNNEIEIVNYNEKVRLLNSSKNTFFENFNNIQIQKKELIDKWQKLKSAFFKKNL